MLIFFIFTRLFQTLESSIKARDTAHVGTNNAVKNLEVHHVQTLTDLRGRIVRCDSSISKLSADVRSCFESIKQLSHQQQEMQSRMMDRMHGLEAQVKSWLHEKRGGACVHSNTRNDKL